MAPTCLQTLITCLFLFMGNHNCNLAQGRDFSALLVSFTLMLGIWTLLAAGAVAREWVGPSYGVLLSFGIATVLMLWARRPRGRAAARVWPMTPLALAAGYLLLPACVFGIAMIGIAFGLEPRPRTHHTGDVTALLSTLVLAPVFEELLYRERLLPQLRRAVGAVPALVLTSLLFALPHVEGWALLGTFLIGLLLGTVMLAGGSVALCIALHMGLNAAIVASDLAAARVTLPPLAAALVGAPLLLGMLWLARRPGREVAT